MMTINWDQNAFHCVWTGLSYTGEVGCPEGKGPEMAYESHSLIAPKTSLCSQYFFRAFCFSVYIMCIDPIFFQQEHFRVASTYPNLCKFWLQDLLLKQLRIYFPE